MDKLKRSASKEKEVDNFLIRKQTMIR